jgi:hypothetical protein
LSMLARLEEEDVVTGVELGEGIERGVVVVVGFGVELGVSFCVREEGGEVVEKMPLSWEVVSKQFFVNGDGHTDERRREK